MRYTSIGYRLPDFISARLFGDRKRFGLIAQPDDPCWKEWEKTYMNYYRNYKGSAGLVINNAGYKVMSKINMAGKCVLEIGPGEINHIEYWNCLPKHYTLADIRQDLLDLAKDKLKKESISCSTYLLTRSEGGMVPFGRNEFDIIVSFYCLEHLYPLDQYLDGMLKVLKPNGIFVGGIPSEGSLAWGLGRFVTSRRWLKKYTTINRDKIICWEHPNFAEDILKTLDSKMKQRFLDYWPLPVLPMDFNLIVRFIYEKT